MIPKRSIRWLGWIFCLFSEFIGWTFDLTGDSAIPFEDIFDIFTQVVASLLHSQFIIVDILMTNIFMNINKSKHDFHPVHFVKDFIVLMFRQSIWLPCCCSAVQSLSIFMTYEHYFARIVCQ